jgi:hypothetical protein
MDTTSNSTTIQADAFYVWDAASKKHVNLQSSITGLAPETLNTLNELATAVGNDPNFASNLQATTSALQEAVAAKADVFTLSPPLLWNLDPAHPEIVELAADCYTKAEVNVLSQKIDDVEYAVFNTKADIFTVGQPLFWDPAFGHQITADCFTKTEVTDKLAPKAESSAVTSALNLKANALNPAFSGTATGLTKDMVQLGNVDNTADASKPTTSAVTSALNLKANALNPAFSGTATGLSKAMVQLGNVDNTTDALKPVSSATTAQLNLKAPLASPSFTGDILIMETAVPGQIKHAFRQTGLSEIRTELQVTGDIASTGTVWSQNEACLTGLQAYTKAEVNTALNLKANSLNPAFSGTATGLSKAMVQLGNADNTTDILKPVSSATTAQLNLKAPLASPSFTGDILIMSATVPGQIKHAFRQSGLSEIKTQLEVSGDIATNGTVWSQNEACLTGLQAYTKTEVTNLLTPKANSTSVFLKTETYSRAQSEALFTYKIDTYTSPLRLAINSTTFATDLRIDPLMDLSIANITATSITTTGNAAITGSLTVGDLTCNSIKSLSTASGVEIRSVGNALLAKVFDGGQTQLYSSLDVSTNVTIGGNLTLTGYLSAKPFVSLRVMTGGGTPSTASVIGTAGGSVVVQNGFITNVVTTRGPVGAANAFLYTFTWSIPHPLGISYVPNAIFRTGSSSDPSPVGVITAVVTSSTSFSIWIRTATNIFVDGNFFCYTVP